MACTAPPAPTPQSTISYRNPSVPIGATARFEEARFAGLWHLRAYLPEAERFDQLSFRAGAEPEFKIGANVCDAAGICGFFAEDLATRRLGQGRYSVTTLAGVDREVWVLWVDEGFRTAVIGNPAGSFAWILDRAPTGGVDRIAAAREILDFNGYSIGQLKVKK